MIMSVAILVLAIMLSLNENSYQTFKSNVRVGKAKAALNDIKNAVDFVYSQGTGAKTRLYVTVPEASNFTITTLPGGVGHIQCIVYVRGQEEVFDAFTDANITGSIPSTSGGYCIDVEYAEAAVSITRSSGSC